MSWPSQIAPGFAIAAAWIAWALSWLAAAAWTRRTNARPGYAREFPNRLVTLIGGVLLFASLGLERALTPFTWQAGEAAGWALFACVVAGMAFAWSARVHLGALWSGNVTRKENHRVIDTGPYALVRHPIYTGVLFSMFATAVERGRSEAVLGAAIVALGLWMKARLEESFLAQGDLLDYAAYRARVPMLVPFTKFAPSASAR